jgi:hypothetical protein
VPPAVRLPCTEDVDKSQKSIILISFLIAFALISGPAGLHPNNRGALPDSLLNGISQSPSTASSFVDPNVASITPLFIIGYQIMVMIFLDENYQQLVSMSD